LETWQSLFPKLWDEKDRKGTKRDEEGTSLDFVPVSLKSRSRFWENSG